MWVAPSTWSPSARTDTALTRLTADYDYQSRLGAHADLSRRFGSEKQFGARLNAIYRNGEGAREGIGETFGEAALALEYRGDRLKLEDHPGLSWTGSCAEGIIFSSL